MKTKLLALGFLCLLLIVAGFGCSDDKGTNSDPMPANLVDTWGWSSATINGEAMTLEEISYTDTAQAMTVTFNADHSWSSAEYYAGTVTFSQSGTCSINGTTFTMTTTVRNGQPVIDEPSDEVTLVVTGDVLTITEVFSFEGSTYIYISIYHRT